LRGQGFGLSNTGFPENAAKLVRHSEWTRSLRNLGNHWADLRYKVADSPGHALQRTGYEFGKKGQRATGGLLDHIDCSARKFPQAFPETNRITQPVNTLDPFVELAVRALSYLADVVTDSQASANCPVWHFFPPVK
jgi:hypothetical protein